MKGRGKRIGMLAVGGKLNAESPSTLLRALRLSKGYLVRGK
jgi:hypothetical protein